MRVMVFSQTPACGVMPDPKKWLGTGRSVVNLLVCFAKSMPFAVGLAANQVEVDGKRLSHRFFMMNIGGTWLVCLNPCIVNKYGRPFMAEEECLSWPGRVLGAKRWLAVDADYCDESGCKISGRRLDGWPAQIFQHETDHLNGVILNEL